MIPGSANPLLLASAATAGGYQVQRSLRFNSSDSAYCGRTFITPTTQGTFTFAAWVKRAALGTTQHLFGVSTNHSFGFTSGNALNLTFAGSSALTTTALFRDPSAWYHIVWTQSGTSHTLYVNNVSVGTATATSSVFNTAVAHQIGAANTANYFSGYLADIHFIDGQALTPSSFTEVSATTGQLIPLAYTGTFGTNGFWLKFSDNSAATAAALGNDYSGNNNDWTPNNLSVTAGAGNDSLVDTPTSFGTDTGVGGSVRGNYCTWNPLKYGGDIQAPTNGNLDVTSLGSATGKILGTIGVSSGKWYWECVLNSSANIAFGITKDNTVLANYPGQDAVDYTYHNDGSKYSNNSGSAYGATYTTNDVIGVAFDADNGTLTFYKNNSSQGQAYSGLTSGPYFPLVGDPSSTPDISATANFGQRAFAYTAPSGFKALCDTNLPAPAVAKPSTVFDVITYTGTGSSLTLPNGSSTPTSISFTPDFAWLKGRSGATNHALYDAVRGVQKDLVSNSTSAETTETTGLTAFGTNTFTVGSLAKLNTSSSTYVAWCWDAGTSTVSNTAGSITSQVRANASAGFSVVSLSAATGAYGHGLGVAPSFIISRARNRSTSWVIYHVSATTTNQYLSFDTNAVQSAPTLWGSITSTTIGMNIGVGFSNGDNAISYCFAPVVGYSNGFSYTGNGAADGSFVYLGFRPRLIMLKRSDSTSNWTLLDTSREGYNVDNDPLYPNLADAEGTTDLLDITSNGFKLRSTDASVNASAGTYIGFAWAENPFQYARAR